VRMDDVWGGLVIIFRISLSLSLSVILNFENSKEEERMMCEDGCS
jgi:hypothetical protein